MDFAQAIEYIRQTHKFGSRMGLECTSDLLRRLGNPHFAFKTIHIAGTNGKGSVTAMLAHVLYSAGYTIGMFTSPSLERFTERIQVDLAEISERDVARLLQLVKEKIEEMVEEGRDHPTEFEIVTAMGFLYFAEKKVDIAVVEVGLGGRLDATNVVDPLLTVITSIGYDHMDILGNTLQQIAFEKAGIIKHDKPTVIYPQHREAGEVIREVAALRQSMLVEVCDQQIDVIYSRAGRQCFDFSYLDNNYSNVAINMTGRHQLLNAATALTALEVLKQLGIEIPEQAVYRGMERIYWPGRMELLQKSPDVLIDGAHNVSGARAVANAIDEYFKGRKIVLLVGILEDKQANIMLSLICPFASVVIATKPDSLRAIQPEKLAGMARAYCSRVFVEADIVKAIELGLSIMGSDDLLLAAGSLYMIGTVRKYFKH